MLCTISSKCQQMRAGQAVHSRRRVSLMIITMLVAAVGANRTLLLRLLRGWAFALAFRREVFASLDVSYTAATLPPSRRCRVNGGLLERTCERNPVTSSTTDATIQSSGLLIFLYHLLLVLGASAAMSATTGAQSHRAECLTRIEQLTPEAVQGVGAERAADPERRERDRAAVSRKRRTELETDLRPGHPTDNPDFRISTSTLMWTFVTRGTGSPRKRVGNTLSARVGVPGKSSLSPTTATPRPKLLLRAPG